MALKLDSSFTFRSLYLESPQIGNDFLEAYESCILVKITKKIVQINGILCMSDVRSCLSVHVQFNKRWSCIMRKRRLNKFYGILRPLNVLGFRLPNDIPKHL